MKKQTLVQPVSELAHKIRARYFPLKLKSGVLCEASTRDQVFAFIEKNFSKVFPRKERNYFQLNPQGPQSKKLRPCLEEYKKIHTEFFLFKKNGKTIGWCYGEMEDFETFYMRNTGILPRYQNNGIYSAFLPQLLQYFYSLGYQRVSSQHHPENQRVLNSKLKNGFVIVGQENHERWGQLIKMVKFLNQDREAFFKKKFL